MGTLIKHAGIVESVVGNDVKVRIVQSSACVSCEVYRNCQISKSREKQIDVAAASNIYQEGEPVMVVVSRHTGLKSVALAFGIPFMLILLTVFCMWGITKDERISALACFITLAIYYGVLYIFRQRIAEQISIKLEKV